VATSFFGSAFLGGEFFFSSAPAVKAVDTHDGFDAHKKHYAKQIEQRVRLRTQLEDAFERAFGSAQKVRAPVLEVRQPALPDLPVDDDDEDDWLLLI